MKIKADNYTIGDLAKFYGVSTDTIRLYDKKVFFFLKRTMRTITASTAETT